MKQYVVDAFTDSIFHGNPAAVCVLNQWPDDELMLKIAKENNLSETAFAVKEENGYRLRWFTPGGEIDLCGHATLGTAFVILNFYEPNTCEVHFQTMRGELIVKRKDALYEMAFPAYDLKPVEITDEMTAALGVTPIEARIGRDLVCVLPNELDVRNLEPDMEKLKTLDGLLTHVTARGEDFDCVSRSFAPKLNVPEDPVCGSGHCHIIPYWTEQLDQEELIAYQASERGGTLYCRRDGNRIFLSGEAVLYSEVEIHNTGIPED